jgi:hypothetical protein
MISAPEGSFGSAARFVASCGVPDAAGAGCADSFCFGSDAPGFVGAILSSDGAISFKGCDDRGFIEVGVSAAHADKATPAMTKPALNDRTMRHAPFHKKMVKHKSTTRRVFPFTIYDLPPPERLGGSIFIFLFSWRSWRPWRPWRFNFNFLNSLAYPSRGY